MKSKGSKERNTFDDLYLLLACWCWRWWWWRWLWLGRRSLLVWKAKKAKREIHLIIYTYRDGNCNGNSNGDSDSDGESELDQLLHQVDLIVWYEVPTIGSSASLWFPWLWNSSFGGVPVLLGGELINKAKIGFSIHFSRCHLSSTTHLIFCFQRNFCEGAQTKRIDSTIS